VPEEFFMIAAFNDLSVLEDEDHIAGEWSRDDGR
jgi:hypothetical protein